jgi:hypothetical protein
VIDGDHLVADPGRTVGAYCRHLGLPFREADLQWQAGALEDWSQFSRWHHKAATTTSFVQTHPEPLPVELRERAEAFVAYHRPFYDRLLARVRTPGAG